MDSDDDLSRAIAASLEDTRHEVIDVDGSDDGLSAAEREFQAQIETAIALSKLEVKGSTTSSSDEKSAPARTTVTTEPLPATMKTVETPTQSSFLSLRAQMEQERLARQKRLRPDVAQSPPRTASSTSAEESETEPETDEEDTRPTKRRHTGAKNAAASTSKSLLTPKPSTSKVVPTIEQVFWEGELRPTATRYGEPRKDGQPTFRLSEILGLKTDLRFAILSSYSLDWAWIYQFFDSNVPVIMVAQPDESGNASVKNVLPKWVRTTPFLRVGRGCQHMKFMLLFYKTGRLRVVVSTANLIDYDWRDMENSVWLQDIPLRSKPIPHDRFADDFPATLQRVLYATNVKPAIAAQLADGNDLPIQAIEELRQKWDWSKVKVHLIASLAGKHDGWQDVIKVGHPALMMAVRRMGMRTGTTAKSKKLAVECQGSSLGLYSAGWLNEFHLSARGESAEGWLDKPKKSRDKLPLPPIKIIFPSKATVRASAAGEIGGGTIFCRKSQWTSRNFPRQLFHESKSKAGPVLMHTKMIISMLQDNAIASSSQASSSKPKPKRKAKAEQYFEDSSDEEVIEIHKPAKGVDNDSRTGSGDDDIEVVEPAAGWAYVGSHNFTPSAWGTLSGSGFNPVLNITNYELGVVFLLKDNEEANRVACFERPPKKYGVQDEAWIQEDSLYFQAEASSSGAP